MTTKPKPATRNQLFVAMGQRLRWTRELVYDSQAEFARSMGMDKSVLSKIESGQRQMSVVNVLTAGNKLGCGHDFLMTGNLASVGKALRVLLEREHPELLAAQPRNPHADPDDPPPPHAQPSKDTTRRSAAARSRRPAGSGARPRKSVPAG